MNANSLKPFAATIQALESFILELEANVGVAHKPSPFEGLLGTETTVSKPSAVAVAPVATQAPVAVQAPVEEKKEASQPAVQQEKVEQKQEKKEKAPKEEKKKQPQQKQAAQPVVAQDLGEFVDLVSVDIRVGEITECWVHPESDKLYCEKINIGTEVREIASGLQKFVPHEQMKGLVLVLANLKPKKLAGFNSCGMVLCASNADHSQVEILRPAAGSQVGERVKVKGFESLFNDAPEATLNPKKKNWENVAPKLLTNDKLEATFGGHVLVTSQGPILAQTLTNSHIS